MPRPTVPMADFDYVLPPDRIAVFPAAQRAASRMLLVRRGTATLEHRGFGDVVELLPRGALLVLNNTRVIRARVELRKPTGGAVEMLLLEPRTPSPDPVVALGSTGPSQWAAMLSGRNVAVGDALRSVDGALGVRVDERNGAEALVTLQWDAAVGPLGTLLEQLGHTPLPPYIKRTDVPDDVTRYQTVYARVDGSVAAPTAGLHFTPPLLDALQQRGTGVAYVTLHVGAGTFRPVHVGNAGDHEMHAERATVDATVLREVAAALRAGRPVIPVGTTSVRTLESAAWLGARLLRTGVLEDLPLLEQWAWVELSSGAPPAAECFGALLDWLDRRGQTQLTFGAQLMVVPGYPFQVTHGMVTNFHQPRSTLILLVAAYLGRDVWRAAYDAALAGGYRFLSYGDASLLLP
jgi:S-adenosylmethionine:tRNA ribosyltransferase-isomerase